ncbi:MAG: cobalamin-independent methionine synthase II family protein [Actinobacteria bacterium]|nr:MAG: cobalamin-independent methionine synthase II family protein [Actinomycetota bacterium]
MGVGVPGSHVDVGAVGRVRPARSPARAETVGSLLRPAALRAAVARYYDEGHSAVLAEERARDASELRTIEDEAIREAVRRQIACGLDVVTDGEFRRWMFMNSFYDAVSGVRTDKTVSFRNADGEDVQLRIHEIVDRLRPADSPGAREAAFMREASGGFPFKVTFPAASIFTHPLTTVVGPDGRGYTSLEEFVTDAVEIERGLVADAIRAGATSIQFDFPLYPYLVDPAWVARFETRGRRIEALVEAAIAADTEVLRDIPDDVTVALHICRGNFRSSWMCEGSLEPLADRVFGELPYDAFLVEWDDRRREGGFEPIRSLRSGALMVMGIVSTKSPAMETEDALLARIRRPRQPDRRGRPVAEAGAGGPRRRSPVGDVNRWTEERGRGASQSDPCASTPRARRRWSTRRSWSRRRGGRSIGSVPRSRRSTTGSAS